jgi:hypothetical protein
MNYRELIDALTFLKENRKLGSEADALVDPFKATVCPVRFQFESMSRTFANPHDPAFEGGQTVVGEIIGENLEFSLLLPPIESEWAESLEKGEQFDGTAKFLGFDGLYQRGIFGYQGKLEVEEKDEATTDEPEGETDEPVVEEDSVEDEVKPVEEPEEPMVLFSGDKPEGDRENLSVEPQAGQEEEAPEPNPVAVWDVPQTEPGEKAEPVSSDPVGPDRRRVEEKTEPVQSNEPKPVPGKKVMARAEIARVMNKKYDGGFESLSPKERKIYFKEKNDRKVRKKHSWKLAETVEKKENNHSEVMRIMNKQYDQGLESLTQAERYVYQKEQDRRRKRNIPNDKTKPKRPGQFRLFLGVVLLFASVISLGKEAAGLFFFFSLLIGYLLHPWVSFWMGEDPCTDLFRTRWLREPKFRRGAGLFALSLCLFSSFYGLAIILFFVSLVMMYGTKTFKDLKKGFKK